MQYFRRLAKLLHPDKNQHPLAKEAFQKLSEAY
jgi:curved DNA-binding protein CbpA